MRKLLHGISSTGCISLYHCSLTCKPPRTTCSTINQMPWEIWCARGSSERCYRLLFLNAQCWKLLNENKPKTLGLFRKVGYFWFIFEINQIWFKSFGHSCRVFFVGQYGLGRSWNFCSKNKILGTNSHSPSTVTAQLSLCLGVWLDNTLLLNHLGGICWADT